MTTASVAGTNAGGSVPGYTGISGFIVWVKSITFIISSVKLILQSIISIIRSFSEKAGAAPG